MDWEQDLEIGEGENKEITVKGRKLEEYGRREGSSKKQKRRAPKPWMDEEGGERAGGVLLARPQGTNNLDD